LSRLLDCDICVKQGGQTDGKDRSDDCAFHDDLTVSKAGGQIIARSNLACAVRGRECAGLAGLASGRRLVGDMSRLVVQRQHGVVLLYSNLHHACAESGRVRLDIGVGPVRIDPLYSDG